MHLIVRPAARRELGKLTSDVAVRIRLAVKSLAENPRPAGCRLLQGGARIWRIRVGDWRVLYKIDDAAGVVTVLRVLHRSKAY